MPPGAFALVGLFTVLSVVLPLIFGTFAAVEDKYGSLDILVNSAGVAHVGTIETTTEDDHDPYSTR